MIYGSNCYTLDLIGLCFENLLPLCSVEFSSATSTIWHIYDNRVLVFLTPQLNAGSISNSWHRCLSEYKEETLKKKTLGSFECLNISNIIFLTYMVP